MRLPLNIHWAITECSKLSSTGELCKLFYRGKYITHTKKNKKIK